ncbi:MAG: hypothetical protein HP002_00015 [Lentisphaeria bacterium]|nr:hypothetical protein [Lentisphaeria bacterium]
MKKRKKEFRGQRGIALLFALGMLSLLLILGLAFVTNALVAQKVAQNNSSRSQAKMLAQSAISRMTVSLMYYNYDAVNKGVKIKDFSAIYSHDRETAEDDNHKHPDAAWTDGLRGAKSLLMPADWTGKTMFESDLKGEWTYFYDENDKIIGRIAYQVLPNRYASLINLDHLLRGVYNYPEGETDQRVPWNVRWGLEVNELNMNTSTLLKDWMTNRPEDEAGLDVSTFELFFNSDVGKYYVEGDSKKENWFKRWFVDGTIPAEPESYHYLRSSGTGNSRNAYYHRFNLGEMDDYDGTEPWYDRLKDQESDPAIEKNSDAAVEKLAGTSEEFRSTDKKTPLGIGIPFLKLIGDDVGSFESLELLRRQIVANLNDFMDEDSIPTSDVSASYGATTNWSTVYNQDKANWPRYTGNEKTPYINELAFGFKVDPSLKKGAGDYENSDVIVSLKLDRAELIAELINIYEDLKNKAGEENLYDYELLAHLESLKLQFQVTVNGRLFYNAGTPPVTATQPKSLTAAIIEKSPLEFNYDKQDVTLKFKADDSGPQAEWKEGYLVYAKELVASSATEIEFNFTKNFQALLGPGEGVVKAEIDEVKIEVLSGKFKLGGVTLMDVHDSDQSKHFGVDFVRWDDPADGLPEADTALTLFEKIPDDKKGASGSGWIAGSSLASVPAPHRYFYLGGMEAKDPRQNLNANNKSDSNETDWSLFTNIKLVDFDNPEDSVTKKKVISIQMPVSSSNEQTEDRTVPERLGAGLRNTDANPNSKDAAGGTAFDSRYDVEFATDPAWRGSADDEHLSTAFIRNAPMESLWELGAIHRGSAWQTLNLTSAKKPGSTTESVGAEDMRQSMGWADPGTSYEGGDGGILEQVKMSDDAYCMGKVDVNMLCESTSVNPEYSSWDDDVGKAIFFNLKLGHTFQNYLDKSLDTTDPLPEGLIAIGDTDAEKAVPYLKQSADRPFENRAQFLDWTVSGRKFANGYGEVIESATYENWPDAKREELVGKTINLLKADVSPSTAIQMVVVAQTVRDLMGPVVRFDYEGKSVTKDDCKYGVFDVKDTASTPEGLKDEPEKKFVYFDEITGEVKAIVDLYRNPITQQIIIRQIEYVE